MYTKELFWGIDLYDLLMTVGMIAALVVLDVYTTKKGMSAASQRLYLILTVIAMMGGVGGAILTQSLYGWIETGVWSWDNGMTFLGGLFFGALTFVAGFSIADRIGKGKFRKEFHMIPEVLGCCVTAAHFFGRLGCFCVGCCYGKETDSIFGIHFPHLEGYNPADYGGVPAIEIAVHPTQLYEAFVLLVLFGICTWLFFRHEKFSLPAYLIGYGIARFVIEFFRADERGALFGDVLSPSQELSLLMLIGGIALLAIQLVKAHRAKNAVPDAGGDGGETADSDAENPTAATADERGTDRSVANGDAVLDGMPPVSDGEEGTEQ